MSVFTKYDYVTSRYQLPILRNNITSSGPDNQRMGDIIDSQLEVVKQVVSNTTATYPGAVITEGVFSATFSSGNSSLTVPSLKAIINGVFVESGIAQNVASMANNQTYYAYASLVEADAVSSSSLQNRQWNLSVGTNGVTPANSILIGKVVTTGAAATVLYDSVAQPTVNSGNDTSKYYYKGIVDHRYMATMDHPSQSVYWHHLGGLASIMPTQIRALGPSLTDLQTVSAPTNSSLPSNLNREIQQLRYQIGMLISGNGSLWYQQPSNSVASLNAGNLGLVATNALMNRSGVTNFAGSTNVAARADHWHPRAGVTLLNGAVVGLLADDTVDKILSDQPTVVVSIALPSIGTVVPGFQFTIKSVGATPSIAICLARNSDLIDGTSIQVISTQWTAMRAFAGPSSWYLG